MSDVGAYAALEAELSAAIDGTTPILANVTVKPGLSAADLASESVRKPVVGIVSGPTEDTGKLATIGQRKRLALFTFELAVVVSSARGAPAARADLRTALETIRDRVHFLSSAQPGAGRFLWKSETPVEVTGDDLLAAVAQFQIESTVGR